MQNKCKINARKMQEKCKINASKEVIESHLFCIYAEKMQAYDICICHRPMIYAYVIGL